MSLLQILSTAPFSRLRLAVMLLMATALAPALFRLWCIKGLVRTIRVDGPSMAETLCGNHFRVTCGDCGIVFRCDADDFPDDRRVVCPNCDNRACELRDEDLRRGDRVLVDTWPYLWSNPKRGDLVMLVEPKSSESKSTKSFAVKRVAGLPGERPGIRNGDFLADGKRIRKSLNELREVKVLVHDNDFLPSHPPIQCWLPSPQSKSDWEAIHGGFRFLSAAEREEAQWLTYEHGHATVGPVPQILTAIIKDNDGYNQVLGPGRNSVRDLLFRCQIEADSGDFMLSLEDPPHKFTVHFQLDSRRFLVRKDNATILGGNLPDSARGFELEVALCDGNLLVVRNRQVLATIPYDEIPASADRKMPSGDASRLEMGAYSGPLEVTHIQVWRDNYYLSPNSLGIDWQAETPLADDHFFLLGDNPPVSLDSRQWLPGGVAGESILGRVIPLGR